MNQIGFEFNGTHLNKTISEVDLFDLISRVFLAWT